MKGERQTSTTKPPLNAPRLAGHDQPSSNRIAPYCRACQLTARAASERALRQRKGRRPWPRLIGWRLFFGFQSGCAGGIRQARRPRDSGRRRPLPRPRHCRQGLREGRDPALSSSSSSTASTRPPPPTTAPDIRRRSKRSATARSATSASSKASALRENPVALQVDDLPRLVEREVHRVVVGRIGVGADEAVLLAHAVDVARDAAGGLVLAVVLVRRGADDVALVLDRIRDFFGRRCRGRRTARSRTTSRPPLFRRWMLLLEHDPEKRMPVFAIRSCCSNIFTAHP